MLGQDKQLGVLFDIEMSVSQLHNTNMPLKLDVVQSRTKEHVVAIIMKIAPSF
jgi:hypothetical protein